MAAAIISALLIVSITVTAFAVSGAEIYGDTVTAATDKTVLVPVKIKNNTGIMGFKITAEYDKSVLASPKVTAGDITKNGMLNDSIGVTPEGRIDVVWSSTRNETADGTMFIISFKTLKTEDTRIKLSCSQPDTFNEAWEDVELKCSDISVEFSADATVSEQKNEASAPADSEEIKNAVDIVLGETDKGHIGEITEDEKAGFIDRTNEILSQLAGKQEKPFESIDEIKNAYADAVEEEFVDEVLSAVDSDKTEEIISDSLASVGAESIDKISAEKKEEFVQRFESNLSQYAPDVDTISDKLTVDEAIETIEQLRGKNEEAATQGKKVPETQKNNTAITVIIIAAIIVAAVTTVAVVYMKRRKIRRQNK